MNRNVEVRKFDGDEDVRRARSGDTSAAGMYLRRSCLPYLIGAARNIAPSANAAEHEDMVQDAILKLLNRWAEGEGPTSDPRQYLIAIMRNSRASALRSPRSQVQQLDDLSPDSWPASTDDDRLRQVDLHAEGAIIRAAFGRLKPAHQRVLSAVLIEGRKPAELVGGFGASAPAISNTLSRAKKALRRAVLIELLSSGDSRCTRNAKRIPENVHTEFATHAESERGLAHVQKCESCQSSWKKFGALASALGIVPLFIATGLMTDAPDAAAATTGSAPKPANADRLLTSSSVAPRYAVLAQPWVLGAGAMVLVLGAVLISGPIIAQRIAEAQTPTSTGTTAVSQRIDENHPDATRNVREDYATRFDVSTVNSGSTASISLDFAVLDSPEWNVVSVSFSLPQGYTLEAPEGWACMTSPTGSSCTPTVKHPPAADFTVTSGSGRPVAGDYSLDLITMSEATIIHGQATGTF